MQSSDLNGEEGAFIEELKCHPLWGGILKKLSRGEPKRFRTDGEDQFNRWVYESGRSDENERILIILGGKHEQDRG